jgi:hypothetical protein
MSLSEHFDKGKKREYDSAWYQINKEKLKEKSKLWRRNNKEKCAESTKLWCAENPEKVALQKREWMAIRENRIKHCLYQAKRRALSNGMEFTITIDDLLPIPDICPILGIKINYLGTKEKRGFVNDSLSIDRVDSSKGYIVGNVRIISWRANRIKSDATIFELEKILKYMKEHV